VETEDWPTQTDLRMVETDLQPMNLGLASAKRYAQDSGMETTRDNGYIHNKPLRRD